MLFSNLFVKNVVQDLTSAGIDWQREKWQSGLGSKFISYHDYREDFYHAFLAGIFTGAGYMVDSNKEHLAYEKTNQEERKEQPT